MKKMVSISILFLLVCLQAVFPGQEAKKGVGYRQVEQFMESYFIDYNQYAQDAATIDYMDKYWAPEFIHIPYLPVPEYPVMNLPAWKNFLIGLHLQLLETLTVDEMSIDTKKLSVTARLKIDFHDRLTGGLVLHLDGIAFYNLKVGERGKLKMTGMKLYVSDPLALMQLSGPPPGM
ncbi:MAG: hypothetical protein MUF15_16785 [Acidobacteria bacterium]|jgi:hypothetical protein|nr:hypothetical protein [Acidobacteriota bacterium]